MDGILIARPRVSAFETIAARLDHLKDACAHQKESAALEVLTDLVPELSRPDRAQINTPNVSGSRHLKVIK